MYSKVLCLSFLLASHLLVSFSSPTGFKWDDVNAARFRRWQQSYFNGQPWSQWPPVNYPPPAGPQDLPPYSPVPVPAPLPPPPPTTPSPPSPPSSDGPPDDLGKLFQLHNTYRAKHGVANLVWDQGLSAQSSQYAQKCVWGHSNTQGIGENLYVSTDSNNIGGAAADAWYNEVSQYDYNNPTFSGATGHFTQMVWASTTNVGCAIVGCPGSMMGWGQTANYVVCQYSPPGNVLGRFAENVKPATD